MNPYRRWSVLFLGSHGQIIQLYRFKALFWGLFIIFIAALGTAGFYYYRHQTQARAIGDITLQVETLERKLAEYTTERETLLVKLAHLESAAGTKSPRFQKSETVTNQPADTPDAGPELDSFSEPPFPDQTEQTPNLSAMAMADDNSPPSTLGKNPSADSTNEKTDSDVADSSAPLLEPPETIKRAAVSQFKSTPLPEVDQLKISYRIKNELRSQGKLKGFTYVLLEGDLEGVTHYVLVPDGIAASERPPIQTAGYEFAVLNYLTIRLTAEAIQDFSWIHQATVYVCDSDGTLLLQEQVPLTISARP